MRVLEALRILETTVYECKSRAIDTHEVREALDLLEPLCREPERIVDHFSSAPQKLPESSVNSRCEGQQQVLRVSFSGIYRNVRALQV